SGCPLRRILSLLSVALLPGCLIQADDASNLLDDTDTPSTPTEESDQPCDTASEDTAPVDDSAEVPDTGDTAAGTWRPRAVSYTAEFAVGADGVVTAFAFGGASFVPYFAVTLSNR